MKQVLQSLKDGSTTVVGVPPPIVSPGHVLIETEHTLISAGTERMLVDFGKAGWIAKARQQPDKVRQVLDKVRTDGLGPTLDAVRTKLDQPVPMGYCNVGTVLEVGDGVRSFAPGDRVVSNGNHAEIVSVPQNLCAAVPLDVAPDQAVFTVLGAIGLQGIRLLKPSLGEVFVVTGLGLIGLLSVQLLRAHGCRVLGLDFDADKVRLAHEYGAEAMILGAGEDPLDAAEAISGGMGVDGVLITAATDSNEPMSQATHMCRKRGRIVLVGVTGLELSRADFYEKELSFQVSCSYGPGRYDPSYEQHGNDYPPAFVRWTEQRNFEAFLQMLRTGQVRTEKLLTHRFRLEAAGEAYELISGQEPSLGVLLEYDANRAPKHEPTIVLAAHAASGRSPGGFSFIGAGNYAEQMLIPAFAATPARLDHICSAKGQSAARIGRKFGFAAATNDIESALGDPETDAVVIATRHDTHADYVIRALESGKHVFVEKPLALNDEQLGRIKACYDLVDGLLLMVGFNRRFAPQVIKLKSLLTACSKPPAMIMTVNAGVIPSDHWTQDPMVGGGRVIGEACHFIDLMRFLAGAPATAVTMAGLGRHDLTIPADSVTATISYSNGAVGTIHYLANGSKRFPKERLEVFCEGRVLQLDNFRDMRGFGWPGFKRMKVSRQDKGNRACVAAFVESVLQGGEAPIPYAELIEVHETTLKIANDVV